MAAGGSETMPAVTEVSAQLTEPAPEPRDMVAASFPRECAWAPFCTWRAAGTSLGMIPGPGYPCLAARDWWTWPQKQRLVMLLVPWNCAVMLKGIQRNHNPDALDPSSDGWICRLWEVLAALSPGM